MASPQAIKAGRAYIELFLKNSIAGGLRKASAQLKSFSQGVQQMGGRLMGLGMAVGAPLALSVKQFAAFDDIMRQVQATSQATQADFQALTDRAKQLGRDTSYSASEAGTALLELARGGMAAGESITAVEHVMNLARATSVDLSEAAGLVVTTIRSFGLEAADAERVVDTLASTANKSAQTLTDVAESMKYAAPLAKAVGMEIEQVGAALASLANRGIKGSMGGTAVRQILTGLADPKAQKTLGQLGVQAMDANGDLRDLSDILTDLNAATQGMGSGRQLSLYSQLFGDRGSGAAMILTQQIGELKQYETELRNAQGAAQKTAEMMDAGVGGAFRKLLSAVQAVTLEIGESLKDVLSAAADWVRDFAAGLAELVKNNKQVVLTIAGTIAGVTALGAGLYFLAPMISAAALGLMGVSLAFSAIGTLAGVAVSAVGLLFTPLGALAAIGAAVGGTLIYHFGVVGETVKWLGEVFSWLKDFATQTWQGISAALSAGDLTAAMRVLWASWQVIWTEGVAQLMGVWSRFKDGIVSTWTAAQQAITSVAIDAWYGLGMVWNDLLASMQQAWLSFTSTFMDYWKGAESCIAKGVAYLIAQIEGIDAAELQRTLEEDYSRKAAARRAEYDQSTKQIERDRATKRDDLTGRLVATKAAADAAAQEAAQRRRQENDAEIGGARRRAEAARAEWRRAIAEAQAGRGEEEGAPPHPFPGAKPELAIPQLQARLNQAAEAGRVAGSFSARALYGMRSGPETEIVDIGREQLAIQKRIEKNTKVGARFV